MQLRTEDGKLTLGSIYKLIVVGWLLSFGLLFIGIFLLLFGILLLSPDDIMINGEMVRGGRDVLLGQVWPFLLVVPIIVPLHALMMGGLVTGGLWLYSLRRPLQVTERGV